jgi:hypothetical protein
MLVYIMVVLFVGAAGWSVGSVFAQMPNMTMPSSNPDLSADHKMTTFSAIGQISSLIITVPEDDFNFADAFNVILTGDWNLSVIKGKITNFAANFLASPMDGTKPHMHQISNFKPTKGTIELTSNSNLLINGTADFKINGQLVWKGIHISTMIVNGSTFVVDPNDSETDSHFGEQSVYGIVTRLIR